MLALPFLWGVSLTHPKLASFLCGEFLLHIPCCIDLYARSFFYTPRAGFEFFKFFLCGEFLLHITCSFLSLSGEFPLYILCWLHFYLESFSYTSHAGFIFIWGVSLTYPVLVSLLSGEFLLHIPCCLDIYARSFSSGEFLLNILCWLHFYVGSFSYTSHADLVFTWGVSLTHPVLI